MNRSPSILAAFSIAALLLANAHAMNGKHILLVGGNMKISTIQSDAVSGSETISSFEVEHPRFNINGTKVACWKKSGSTWYLSIMDVTTKAFTDLLNANTTWSTTDAGGRIMWPAGDWIYFERPSLSGEIWRINSTDLSKKELIVDYTLTTDPTPLKIYNFVLTADSRLALTELNGRDIWTPTYPVNGGDFVYRFPPTGDDPKTADNLLLDMPNCNTCFSPTGAFSGDFFNGVHQDLKIWQWNAPDQRYDGANVGHGGDGSVNVFDDIEVWSGQSDWSNTLEGPDWSVNSDRWLTISVSTTNGAASNSVAFSWADQKTIRLTNNTNTYSEGGCLYVEGAANNVQNINGTWSAVTPVTVLPRIDVSGSQSPYHITLTSKPAGADFYYTTNGSDPTQSSAHYTGSFDLSVSATARTTLNVRAYLSGSTSNVVQKLLCFDNTQSTGLTCQLWTDVAGINISDLTSHQGYPNSPDQTWLAYDIGNQYGSPWVQVGGSSGNGFGYRTVGYFIPHITGSYVFNGTSNSAVSVRIGTSSSPASTAEVLSMANSGDVWGTRSASSSPVTLQAGVWYYLEALCKGDNSGYTQASVSVTSPSDAGYALMPIDSTPRNLVQNVEPRTGMIRAAVTSTRLTNGAVYDVLGNRVSAVSGSGAVSQWRLPAGIYLVKSGNGRSGEVRRLVVRTPGVAGITSR